MLFIFGSLKILKILEHKQKSWEKNVLLQLKEIWYVFFYKDCCLSRFKKQIENKFIRCGEQKLVSSFVVIFFEENSRLRMDRAAFSSGGRGMGSGQDEWTGLVYCEWWRLLWWQRRRVGGRAADI